MKNDATQNSTTVRTLNRHRWLGAGLVATAAVAPSLAAAAAERLFMTPPRARAQRSDRSALERGDPFTVRLGRQRLQGWRLGDGPAVLLVHGWGGRATDLAPFITPLRAAGCAVVAFDAPAHGRSSGATASVPAFAEALSAVADRVGARAAVGHSIGAAGLGWALGGGLTLDAAVLVSPPRSPADFFQRFCQALGLPEPLRDGARARLERRFGSSLEEFDLASRVARSATPLLVVHDRRDKEIPWTDGDEIARSRPDARFHLTDGLGHRRILRDPGVAASIAAFVQGRVARCACGRPAGPGDGAAPRCDRCALERELFDPSLRARPG